MSQYFLCEIARLLFFSIRVFLLSFRSDKCISYILLQILFSKFKLHLCFVRTIKWQKKNKHWSLKICGHLIVNLHWFSCYFVLYKSNQVAIRSPKSIWPARLDSPYFKDQRKMTVFHRASSQRITQEMDGRLLLKHVRGESFWAAVQLWVRRF